MLVGLKRLFLISRPSGWLPIACVFLGGAALGKQPISVAVFLGLIFSTLPLGLIAYGVNDIADKEADAVNFRKGKMTGALLSPADEHYLKFAVPLTAIFFTAVNVLSRHYLGAASVAAICILSLAYSLPPVRLKERLALDIIANGLGMCALFIYGFTVNSVGFLAVLPRPHTLGIIFLTAAAFHTLFALADYEVDLKFNVRSSVVRLGKTRATLLCGGFFLADFMLALSSSGFLQAYFLICIIAMVFLLKYNRPVIIYRTLGGLALLIPLVLVLMFST